MPAKESNPKAFAQKNNQENRPCFFDSHVRDLT